MKHTSTVIKKNTTLVECLTSNSLSLLFSIDLLHNTIWAIGMHGMLLTPALRTNDRGTLKYTFYNCYITEALFANNLVVLCFLKIAFHETGQKSTIPLNPLKKKEFSYRFLLSRRKFQVTEQCPRRVFVRVKTCPFFLKVPKG